MTSPVGEDAAIARRDWLWASGTGLAALVVYVRTLAPGMVAVMDTPMFQFIGRVLGVAHNPGYPLYVLLTHPLSYLPMGSLAWRINLFSALCAAVTTALVFLIVRRLGCRRLVSAATALGMAFGHVYWSQSIIAEVYALDTALIAGIVLLLLVWRETGKLWQFYAAIGLLAAGFGNHTTIAGFAPGVALYAWLTRRDVATRPRTVVVSAALCVAGVLQYGFILIRSRQGGAYVESPATTLAELASVISGRQFGDRLFTFGWREVVFERVPWLVEHVLVPELTVAGLVLALVGMVVLLRSRRAEAALLLSGCLAIVAFALNYAVVDLPVFLIPATLVLWMMAAVGGERLVLLAERVPGAAAVAPLVLLGLPAWQVVRNYDVTNRSHDTHAAVTFDRLFETLPRLTAVVREDFLVDRMVMYKVLGDPPARPARVDLVDASADAVHERLARGYALFAFPRSAERLRREALNVGFAPIALLDDPLPDVLARIPAGYTVAVAVPQVFAPEFVASGAAAMSAIGGPRTLTDDASSALTVVGVTGARRGAFADTTRGCVVFEAGHNIGPASVPVAFAVEATTTEAAVRQGGRDLVRSADGAVLVVWRPDGQIEQAAVLQAPDGFRVPMAVGPLAVHPIHGELAGEEIGEAWTPVTTAAHTGSVAFQVPESSRLIAYVAADEPLFPRVIDQAPDVEAAITTVSPADASPAIGDDVPYVYRIDIAGNAESASVLMAFGGVPRDLVARMDEGRSAAVFSVDTVGLLRTPDRSTELLLMARDEQQQLIGSGWSAVDSDEVGPFRWMSERKARVLLPAAGQPDVIRMQAFHEVTDTPASVRLVLNGRDLGPRTVASGWQRYEWSIPEGVASPGTNAVTLVRDDGEEAGFAVSDLRLLYVSPADAGDGSSDSSASDAPSCS